MTRQPTPKAARRRRPPERRGRSLILRQAWDNSKAWTLLFDARGDRPIAWCSRKRMIRELRRTSDMLTRWADWLEEQGK